MTTIRLVLGDQLSHCISSLEGCDKENDTIIMAEVMEEATYVKHHKKKMIFLFSAMRHFAKELKKKSYSVHYTKLDDQGNKQSFDAEVKRAIKKYRAKKLTITFPGEYRILKKIEHWKKELAIDIDIREDSRFLSTPSDFKQWATGKKQLRMEYFYREMRKKHSILIQQQKPIGGKWNFDAENRKKPAKDLSIPATYKARPDADTRAVIEMVEKKFPDHFGKSTPFHFAVTRKQALTALKKFIDDRLIKFGDYQDAMLENESWMFHSHIGLYLNAGLLLPLECIQAAEAAYHEKVAPLNAAEGFIRQILGWREYVRGFYWLNMPGYNNNNFFSAKRKLPNFYWDGDTEMNCIHQCIKETDENAYAHHIQRLMVLGNFALLAGINPKNVNEWYLLVYADAYEWVELPNVSGMALFADGGLLTSKPYAASGSYINKMSNYCQNCRYNVNKKTGKEACPFNYLYWDFLARNKDKLSDNPRLAMIYKSYERMTADKKAAVTKDSKDFLEQLNKD